MLHRLFICILSLTILTSFAFGLKSQKIADKLLRSDPNAPFLALKNINQKSLDSLNTANYKKKCGSIMPFNTSLKNGRVITIYSIVNCPKIPICGPLRYGGSLWINQTNQMLSYGSPSRIDSISNQALRAFKSKNYSSFTIKWHEETDLLFIEEVLENVVEGKLEFYKPEFDYYYTIAKGKNLLYEDNSDLFVNSRSSRSGSSFWHRSKTKQKL